MGGTSGYSGFMPRRRRVSERLSLYTLWRPSCYTVRTGGLQAHGGVFGLDPFGYTVARGGFFKWSGPLRGL